MIELVDSDVFAFADGDAGKVCDLGSAPAVDDLDVLCVNSNTTVDTPTGFTLRRSDVNNQGAYIYSRKAAGGEGSTVTINTNGNHNTAVVWSRWSGTNEFDVAAGTQAQTTNTTMPAHSSGTLAEEGELVVVSAALHSVGTANQNTPVWGGGVAAITGAPVSGSGATGARNYSAYVIGAGTGAVSPTMSWSGDGCVNRYMQTAAFTAAAGGVPAVPGETLTAAFNRLAGTTGLTAAAAANIWAETEGLTLRAAVNVKAGTTGLHVAGALNEYAGTTGLTSIDALSHIEE